MKNHTTALYSWQKMKWLKSSGAPVLNAELWKELNKQILKCKKHIEIRKVKGHSKDANNKTVDKLAKFSAKNAFNKPLSIKIIRRKITTEKTVVGCVGMNGQRIIIRIIESEYLKEQRIDRYRYEVMSKSSIYFGMADFLCTKEQLKAGHIYSVRFNKNNNNPSVIKVFKEILNII